MQEVRAIHSDFSSSAVTGNCNEFKPEQWTILQLLVSSIVMVGHQFLCPFRCSQERDTIGHAGKRSPGEGGGLLCRGRNTDGRRNAFQG